MPIQIQLRRGTAAQWTAANPTLAQGELAMETDTYKFKVGTGSTAWNSLSYGGLVGATGGFNSQQGINTQSAAYTLVLSDAGKLIQMTSASNVTVTIPTNGSVAFPIGTHIDICSYGAGQVTIAGAGGVTVNARGALKTLSLQYSVCTCVKLGADEWLYIGPAT